MLGSRIESRTGVLLDIILTHCTVEKDKGRDRNIYMEMSTPTGLFWLFFVKIVEDVVKDQIIAVLVFSLKVIFVSSLPEHS